MEDSDVPKVSNPVTFNRTSKVDDILGASESEPSSMLKPFKSRFKAMPLVQENPLNSHDALKMRKELSCNSDDGDGTETPVVKSLFDIPGNSKFKNKKGDDSDN